MPSACNWTARLQGLVEIQVGQKIVCLELPCSSQHATLEHEPLGISTTQHSFFHKYDQEPGARNETKAAPGGESHGLHGVRKSRPLVSELDCAISLQGEVTPDWNPQLVNISLPGTACSGDGNYVMLPLLRWIPWVSGKRAQIANENEPAVLQVHAHPSADLVEAFVFVFRAPGMNFLERP
ncbi:hypothetical protein MGYG_00580 [Nannizzia gypsea CBS 118893]|uniref:Uncharacterized protein n=1 Tax=Arthroderma gypseum (strain ATCC MYA-4604 / CBS 118893) TaxID=535722 RepID=E5R0I0_ARTGP|nr:hypothetical protein MGYG_00580 [Nannizzia gypsea CBS 118893]EFQ97539.1 hypothetical protein MGYG_00580 [Nannizzia gypsea CBS 118893]